MADVVKTMGATFSKVSTAVINLTDISRSGTAGGVMETTTLSSTGGKKTFQTSGVFDEGEISISFNWDPSHASHIAIVTDWQAGTSAVYNLVFGNSDTFQATMFPISMDWTNSLSDDGKLEATATFKLTGAAITDPS